MATSRKVSTQMRYDEILYEKTKVIANNEMRTINAQIEYFMKKGIEDYEREQGTISLPEYE